MPNSVSAYHLIPLIRQNLELSEHFDEAKRVMAQSILDSIETDYRTKAQGGIGEDGIYWEPTKKFLKKGGLMLINTGDLLNSFQFEVTSTGFRIYNDLVYAYRQLSQRLPWPLDQLPASWLKRMLDAGRPYLVRAVEDAAKKSVQDLGGQVAESHIR